MNQRFVYCLYFFLVLILAGSCISFDPSVGPLGRKEKIITQKPAAPRPDEYPTDSLYEEYQSYDFSKVDSHALAASESAARSTGKLVEYLISGTANELEKARAIYRWIAGNISYDVDAYLTDRIPNQDSAAVLKSKTAVCEGFSSLFVALAREAGLEAVQIKGYSKAYEFTAKERKTNHAWNAVKIGGRWWHVEPTWGTGFLLYKPEAAKPVFKRNFLDFYFLPRPQDFIFTHFPDVEAWQLLKQPAEWKDFARWVRPQPWFFYYGLTIASLPARDTWVRADRRMYFTLPVDNTVELSGALYFLKDEGGDVRLHDCVLVQRLDFGPYEFHAIFPEAGNYYFIVSGKRREEEGGWELFRYGIVVKEAETETIFPVTYAHANKFYLYTPRTGRLTAGKTYEFRLQTEIATNITVFEDQVPEDKQLQNHLVLKKEGNLFYGEFTPRNPGQSVWVTYGTSDSGNKSYGIFKYIIVKEKSE